MSKNVSFRDVLHALSCLGLKRAFSETDLLYKKNRRAIQPILHHMGIDVHKPVDVLVVNHRDLNDRVGVGYMFSGSMRLDPEWRYGKYTDVFERIAATAYEDVSLTYELYNLLGRATNFWKEDEVNCEDWDVYEPQGFIDPEYHEVKYKIDILTKIKNEIEQREESKA